MYILFMILALILTIIFDITKIFPLTKKWLSLILLLFFSHIFAICIFLNKIISNKIEYIIIIISLIIFSLYFLIRLNFYVKPCKIPISYKARFMMGGRRITLLYRGLDYIFRMALTRR